MGALALTLVLLAALGHAGWNLLAKRAAGGIAFTWTFIALSAVIYAPVAFAWAAFVQPVPVGPVEAAFVVGTALLHIAYFLFLAAAYRAGDLSLVYPLARGSGPVFAVVGAVVLYGERPSPLALAGAALVIGFAFVLAGDPRRIVRGADQHALRYALAVGGTIALYTLWDAYAVSRLHLPPLVYEWSADVLRTLLLLPLVMPRRAEVAAIWRSQRAEVLGIAVLAPLAYVLVLAALAISAVSYVAPAREVSILVGTLAAGRFFGEGQGLRRVIAAAGIVAGVIAIAVG